MGLPPWCLLRDDLSATDHAWRTQIVETPRGRSKLGLNSPDFAAPRSALGSRANLDTRRRPTRTKSIRSGGTPMSFGHRLPSPALGRRAVLGGAAASAGALLLPGGARAGEEPRRGG